MQSLPRDGAKTRLAPQVTIIIEALKPGVVSLIRDLNGNHVIQRCLQVRSQGMLTNAKFLKISRRPSANRSPEACR